LGHCLPAQTRCTPMARKCPDARDRTCWISPMTSELVWDWDLSESTAAETRSVTRASRTRRAERLQRLGTKPAKTASLPPCA
jgi:hypothetical protein